MSYTTFDNIFSNDIPTVVGAKAVYVRLHVRDFLDDLCQVTNRIVAWSSIYKKTVEHVAGFLFQNYRAPFDILGQDNCRKVEVLEGQVLTIAGNKDKPLFLKVLGDHLFLDPNDRTSFSKDNSLLIDDSPQKSVLNEDGNAIFLQTWDRSRQGDKFLMDTLGPWLKQL